MAYRHEAVGVSNSSRPPRRKPRPVTSGVTTTACIRVNTPRLARSHTATFDRLLASYPRALYKQPVHLIGFKSSVLLGLLIPATVIVPNLCANVTIHSLHHLLLSHAHFFLKGKCNCNTLTSGILFYSNVHI